MLERHKFVCVLASSLDGSRKLMYNNAVHISCGRVVKDFEKEAKTRCNLNFERHHCFYKIFTKKI